MTPQHQKYIIWGASALCSIPSFILTVIPTAGHDPGMAVCMALGVAGLPFIPFALRRAQGAREVALMIVLGAFLLLYNFSNALDALNRNHAADTGDARGKIAAAAALNEKISALDVRKGEVGPHKIVSRESAQAAQRAKDAECGTGYGRKCREREDALKDILRDRALTERAESIEHDLDSAKAALAAIGPVPKTADQTATQLANFAGLFWAPAAARGDDISSNRPIFRALTVELFGGLMPWVLVTVFGGGLAAAKPKAKPRKGAKPPSKDSVLAWHADRIVPREGRSIRAGAALADYEGWCQAKGFAPVNLTEFGKLLKAELGVRKEDKNKRTSYLDIGFKPSLKVIAAADKPAAKAPQNPRKRPGEAGEAREGARPARA